MAERMQSQVKRTCTAKPLSSPSHHSGTRLKADAARSLTVPDGQDTMRPLASLEEGVIVTEGESIV